eukprot:CAMPEP_0115865094 /NCGR_PEP_ID=MMETSP0287-20121206/19540_1 /TAXON_ID=412157 /ORGANISM="Chrysochromulina rotalis, Strain UIO044" /LENGTH=121 /DNA_ID=CAMNT_0003319587 /DNA_START=514 /DNA_END=879 /DNA_ORIENTATION=+
MGHVREMKDGCGRSVRHGHGAPQALHVARVPIGGLPKLVAYSVLAARQQHDMHSMWPQPLRRLPRAASIDNDRWQSTAKQPESWQRDFAPARSTDEARKLRGSLHSRPYSASRHTVGACPQ